MRTLTIIRGLPGSGKSTLAKALVYSGNHVRHYEADMFHMKDGVYRFDATKVKDAHAWCQKKCKEALEVGANVVVSNTFTQKWEMTHYVDLAAQYGYKVQVVICKGDFGSIHSVPDSVIEKMANRWEY